MMDSKNKVIIGLLQNLKINQYLYGFQLWLISVLIINLMVPYFIIAMILMVVILLMVILIVWKNTSKINSALKKYNFEVV